jgi:ATP phosphoribosyltransferase regulatory subunit
MSRFEEYDLYVRNKDFLQSQQVITFADRSGKLLALKPDVTLSIIKNAPDEAGCVQKMYYNESVYRDDPATHTMKEIMQCGLECVGDLTGYEIAEVLLLAAKSLDALGGEFVLDVSHMGLVAAVLESSGIASKKQALRHLSQKSGHEMRALCEAEGADFEKLNALINLYGDPAAVIGKLETLLSTDAELAALQELQMLCNLLCAQGFGANVRVDFSVGSVMKYYSGVVFKGYLSGIPAPVLSGGQYDKLLQKMHRSSRAIGFAVYADLLQRREEQQRVDTLILHDGNADPMALIEAAQEAAKSGTVLVTTKLPEDRTWNKLIEM